MVERIVGLAKRQPNFIDIKSARDEIGITVSYLERSMTTYLFSITKPPIFHKRRSAKKLSYRFELNRWIIIQLYAFENEC